MHVLLACVVTIDCHHLSIGKLQTFPHRCTSSLTERTPSSRAYAVKNSKENAAAQSATTTAEEKEEGAAMRMRELNEESDNAKKRDTELEKRNNNPQHLRGPRTHHHHLHYTTFTITRSSSKQHAAHSLALTLTPPHFSAPIGDGIDEVRADRIRITRYVQCEEAE